MVYPLVCFFGRKYQAALWLSYKSYPIIYIAVWFSKCSYVWLTVVHCNSFIVIVNNPIILYKYLEFVLLGYPPSKILILGNTRDKKVSSDGKKNSRDYHRHLVSKSFSQFKKCKKRRNSLKCPGKKIEKLFIKWLFSQI